MTRTHSSYRRENPFSAIAPSSADSSVRAGLHGLWLRWRNSSEDGQSLVEFGMVVPLLLLVLSGIFSFGIIFNQYEMLTNATNSAARAFALSASTDGSLSQAPNNDPCAYVATIVQQDAPNLTAGSLKYTIVYTVTKTSTATTLANKVNAPSCNTQTMTSGDTVQVTVTYPVSATLFGWATKNLTLSGSSTELVQ